ncbi:MAG: DUF169 domain-containing protein [Acidimicrobiales bacterium]|jgi:uncharacterized protein (DUF169 family)
MDSPSWSQLADALTASLDLTTPPIAITFGAGPPPGIDAYEGPKPPPAPDGRTGPVPAGCVFWTKAIDRTFSTVASDHANCSVGTLVHGFAGLDELAGNSDVAALVESGWVSVEQIPDIPAVRERPGSVTYGPLAETPLAPDVVLIRVNAGQLMLLAEAVPGLQIGGKPQCRVIALAKEHGELAASLGCTLSRSRTGLPGVEMTCAIPAFRLAEVVRSVEATARIDAVAESYAASDIRRFVET